MNPDITLDRLSHANLWVGGANEAMVKGLGVSSFDTIWWDAAADGGIKSARGFVSELLLAPQFGDVRLGVIVSAESLTTEAQNALLKLLEEPAPSVKLILLAATDARILPTIVSRCRVNRFTSNQDKPAIRQKMSNLERFLAAETLSKDETVKTQVLNDLQAVYQDWVAAGRPQKQVNQVEKNWLLYHNLETQINKRLLLEQFALEGEE